VWLKWLIVATPLPKELVLARQMPQTQAISKKARPEKQHDRFIKTSEERASVYIRSPPGRLESRRLLACGTKVVQIRLFNAKSSAQSERPVIFFAVPTRVQRGIVANSLTQRMLLRVHSAVRRITAELRPLDKAS
jgi:hypothetical protein